MPVSATQRAHAAPANRSFRKLGQKLGRSLGGRAVPELAVLTNTCFRNAGKKSPLRGERIQSVGTGLVVQFPIRLKYADNTLNVSVADAHLPMVNLPNTFRKSFKWDTTIEDTSGTHK
jgi:hypothetical protein